MPTCRLRSDCRLCNNVGLQVVCTLSSTPPANDFRPASSLKEIQDVYPLELMLCNECGHLQLGHVVDPESLFSDYVYVSGTSPSFVAHFDAYANTVWTMIIVNLALCNIAVVPIGKVIVIGAHGSLF